MRFSTAGSKALALAAFCVVFQPVMGGAAALEKLEEGAQAPRYVPGELIVKLRPEASLDDLQPLNQRFGVTTTEPVFPTAPNPRERLAALKKTFAALVPEHTSWHWWARKENQEAKDYAARLAKARDALEAQIQAQEALIVHLDQRQARAPGGADAPRLDTTYLLRASVTTDIPAMAKAYSASPKVEYAEPNHIVTIPPIPSPPPVLGKSGNAPGPPLASSLSLGGASTTKKDAPPRVPFPEGLPNDTYVDPDGDGQWAKGAWGQPYEDLWGLKQIHAHEAWKISEGAGVVVAVIDTGVDWTHEDLAANIWTNPREIPGNGVDDDGNGYVDDARGWDFVNHDANPLDDHGHGTHVAGTIAAVGNNGHGIIGAAPHAAIMPVKGFDDSGSGTIADAAAAVHYAVGQGADVINASWGGAGSSTTLTAAVHEAYTRGCVFVVAAGNSNDDVIYYYPAGFREVISVGATNHDDHRASFSNYGYTMDVAAPGGAGEELPPGDVQKSGREILSLRAGGTDMYQDGFSIVGERYYRSRGTSMAAPHVAGVAALIVARQPTLSVEGVRQILRTSADDIEDPGLDPWTGAGRVNAARAVAMATGPVLSARIASPLDHAPHGPAGVPVLGTAAGLGFRQYELFVMPWPDPNIAPPTSHETWTSIGVGLSPVEGPAGLLGTWDTSTLETGGYLLRLDVTALDGRVFRDVVLVVVRAAVPVPIVTAPKDQRYPAISPSGRYVVWQDYRDDPGVPDDPLASLAQIYLRDLETGQETPLSPVGYIAHDPDVSDQWVVWAQEEVEREPSPATATVQVYQLGATGGPRTLPTAAGRKYFTKVSGSRVVWLNRTKGVGPTQFSIRVYDLATETEQVLAESANWLVSPAIAGDRVIWQSPEGLNLYDLSTGAPPRLIVAASEDLEMPVIDGGLVAWADRRRDPASRGFDIYLYDLATGTERRVTKRPVGFGILAISGSRLVWDDFGDGDIYLYDATTDAIQRVVADRFRQVFPDIAGRRIVVEDWGAPSIDIYLYELPPPVTRTVIPLAPKGGERIEAGTPFTITWRLEDGGLAPGAKAPAALTLLSNGGGRFRAIGDAVPGQVGDNAFVWTVPRDVPPDAGYRILFEVEGSSTTALVEATSAPFEIVSPPPMVSITAPREGEQITAGDPVTIRWRYENASLPAGQVGLMRLALWRGGACIQQITPSAQPCPVGDGQFTWTVPTEFMGNDYQLAMTVESAKPLYYYAAARQVQIAIVPPPPELVAGGVWIIPTLLTNAQGQYITTVNAQLTFDAVINNTGGGDAGPCSITVSVDGRPYHTGIVRPGIPKQTTAVYGLSGSWFPTAGLHTWSFTINADRAVPERDYANNTTAIQLVAAKGANRPPVLEALTPQTVAEAQRLTFVVPEATDEDGDSLTYSARDLPGGAAFDPATRTLTWTPAYDQGREAPYVVTIAVSDGTNAPVTAPLAIAVTDVAHEPLTLLAPRGGEKIKQGDSLMIRWEYGLSDPATGGVIRLIPERGAAETVIHKIPDGMLPGAHAFSWQIPDALAPGRYAISIEVSTRDSSDPAVRSQPFEIIKAAPLPPLPPLWLSQAAGMSAGSGWLVIGEPMTGRTAGANAIATLGFLSTLEYDDAN